MGSRTYKETYWEWRGKGTLIKGRARFDWCQKILTDCLSFDITSLKGWLDMQKQLDHYEFKSKQEQNSNDIIFILDNFEHSENIGSAFRIADAFNIKKIIIISEQEIDMRKVQKTARNCEYNIDYSIYGSAEEALKEIERLKYTPINIEITNTSVPLRDVDFANIKKVALILGNEKHGISDKILQAVPMSCHIEMYGNNSSMNVATSLAIAAYKVSEDMFKVKKIQKE